MLDPATVIRELSSLLDEETRSLLDHPGKLLLCGSHESVFLKAVQRKASAFGIECDFTPNVDPPYQGIIVDKETAPPDIRLGADVDIDHSFTPGMSAVSQAVLTLLFALNLVGGKNITVVGRGHAVQGLAERLIANDATVTVAHSKTKELWDAVRDRDVVVYATPSLRQKITYGTRDLVIDLGSCFPFPELLDCPYVNKIGQLTVSTLLNRFAKNGGNNG